MADSDIPGLTEATTIALADLFHVVVDPAGTPADRKMAFENLLVAAPALYATESGTSFNVSATHRNRIVRCTANTDVTITVPTGLGAGFSCGFLPEGDGQLIFTDDGTTTLEKAASYHLKSAEQNAPVFLHAPVADTLFLSGELESAAIQTIPIQVIPAGTACSVGDGAGDTRFFVPDALDGHEIVGVQGHVTAAGTTDTMDVQLHNVTQSVDILTDLLQFASGAKASDDGETVNESNNALAANDEIRFDIDAVHSTPAEGLFLALKVQLPA